MTKLTPRQQEVMEAVHAGARSSDEIVRATSVSKNQTYNLISDLKKKKLVKLDKEGGYVPTRKAASTTTDEPEPNPIGRSISGRTKKILAQLSENHDVRLVDIAHELGLTPSQVSTVMKRCVERGQAVNTGHGTYRLTTSKQAAAAGKRGNGHAAPEQIAMEHRSNISEIRRIQDLCTALFDAVRALEPRVMSKKRMALLRGLTRELD